MRYLFCFLLLFCFVIFQPLHAQLRGTVYLDENANHLKDRTEIGVKDAIVSNGFYVVRTDDEGRFVLPHWEKQRFVTIYTGRTFSSPTRFWPITSKTSSYDFAVTPRKQNDSVNFLHISDTETFEYGDWVNNLKKYIQVHKPDFVVHTGDICYKAGMLWHGQNLTEKDLGIPIYYCLGNHDLVKGDYGEEFFEQQFGPAWYAFEEGNVLYVITPMMNGDFPPSFNYEDIGGWLQNLLSVYPREQPKIFFNHDLLSNKELFVFNKNASEQIVLNEYNLKAWLFGHWHINMVKNHGKSGVVSYSTATIAKGGIDHSPSSFRKVVVDSNGNTKSDLIWSFINKSIEIVSPNDHQVKLNHNKEADISVNVYDSGSEVDSVRYGIWRKTSYTWDSVVGTRNWKLMRKASDWNWRASFDPGSDRDFVLVIDAFLHSGEILHRKQEFYIDSNRESTSFNGVWTNLGGNKEHHPVVEGSHKADYELIWTNNIGSNIYMSSPVVMKDLVFAAGFDDNNGDSSSVVCWNANTGAEVWRFTNGRSIKNQIVIADNKVIATDIEGITYALDLRSGNLKWKVDLQQEGLPGFVTGLVTDGEIIYTGFAESLSALDASTGKVLWRNTHWRGGEGTTPAMTIADSLLIVSQHWRALHAHNRFTGELIWSRHDEGLRFRDGVVAFVDDFLWVAEGDKLFKLEPSTGKTVHAMKTNLQHTGTSAPIKNGERVIVASSHPGIAAYDLYLGKQIWQHEVDPALFYTPSYFSDQQRSIESTPIQVGDHVILGGMDGNVRVVDANDGRLLWKMSLGAPILTSAAINENGFFICDFAGNIYCFGIKQ